MNLEDLKEKATRKIQEIEYEYWFDKKEFGKVMIIASLSVLLVSVHALLVMQDAVEQAENSTQRMKTTAALVGSESFQQSMEALAGTGATIQGEEIDKVVSDLEYASESVGSIEDLTKELKESKKTYQWTIVAGMIGMVIGISSIYI